jgi:hypothetical protein
METFIGEEHLIIHKDTCLVNRETTYRSLLPSLRIDINGDDGAG